MSTTTVIIAIGLVVGVFLFLRKRSNLSPEERKEIMEALEAGATLVDVRTRPEFETDHPKGAINVPVHQLPAEIERLEKKPAPIVVCCATGMRSARAAKQLRRANIETLDLGGRGNWPE